MGRPLLAIVRGDRPGVHFRWQAQNRLVTWNGRKHPEGGPGRPSTQLVDTVDSGRVNGPLEPVGDTVARDLVGYLSELGRSLGSLAGPLQDSECRGTTTPERAHGGSAGAR